jgi:hypothetical protein
MDNVKEITCQQFKTKKGGPTDASIVDRVFDEQKCLKHSRLSYTTPNYDWR